jgi:hypothetical protein
MATVTLTYLLFTWLSLFSFSWNNFFILLLIDILLIGMRYWYKSLLEITETKRKFKLQVEDILKNGKQ